MTFYVYLIYNECMATSEVTLTMQATFELLRLVYRAIDYIDVLTADVRPDGEMHPLVEDLRTWTVDLLNAAWGENGGRILGEEEGPD